MVSSHSICRTSLSDLPARSAPIALPLVIVTLLYCLGAAWITTAAAAPRESYPFSQFLKARGQSVPSISPDGRALAYLDPSTGTKQAWRVDVDGGWPTQLTFLDQRIIWVSWSLTDPDLLLVSSDTGGNERRQMYLVDAAGANLRRLTHNDDARHGFGGWSPDGRMIAYRSNARQASVFDAYVLELATGESRRVYESDGIIGVGGFSPDSRQLLIRRTFGPDENRLLVCDLDAGETRLLTPAEQPARYYRAQWIENGAALLLLTDLGREFLSLARLDVASGEITFLRTDEWPAESLEVAIDGSRFALCLNHDGYSELLLWDLVNDRALPPPPLSTGVVYGLDFTPDGQRLAIELRAPRRPGELYVYDVAAEQLIQVTHATLAGIPEERLTLPRLVHYPTFDGREIPGLLFEPEGVARGDGATPPPCLVYIHGGPTGQSRPRFSSLVQYFATRGFVVFAPNVRGSTGYGRTYMNLDNVELREDSVKDLKYGVDWLVDQGLVDADKVALYGGSYGGYMVLAALTLYPDLAAVGVESVGIANFVTFLERTGSYRRAHREQEYGSLEHDRELLERISPLTRADRIRVPLMVIHGVNDPRVPVYEAEQIVAALEARGLPVEFLRHEQEGHGVSRLETRIATYTRMAAFLHRHLGLPAEDAGGGE